MQPFLSLCSCHCPVSESACRGTVLSGNNIYLRDVNEYLRRMVHVIFSVISLEKLRVHSEGSVTLLLVIVVWEHCDRELNADLMFCPIIMYLWTPAVSQEVDNAAVPDDKGTTKATDPRGKQHDLHWTLLIFCSTYNLICWCWLGLLTLLNSLFFCLLLNLPSSHLLCDCNRMEMFCCLCFPRSGSKLTPLCIPTQRLSTQSFLYLFFSGPLREIFIPEADAANFFRRRSRRAAKSQDEIDGDWSFLCLDLF